MPMAIQRENDCDYPMMMMIMMMNWKVMFACSYS